MLSFNSDRMMAARRAGELLARYSSSIPIDIEAIAAMEGILVRRQPLEDEVSGLLMVRERDVIIGVNESHHPNRQRFTIAHELGHYVMHRDDARFFIDAAPVFFRSNDGIKASRDQEVAANAFAAAILMPEAALRSALEQSPIDVFDDVAVRRVADRFRVSPQALLIRLSELDLVIPGQ